MYIIISFSLPYAIGFANVMCSNNTDIDIALWCRHRDVALHLDKQ